ncbi:hypothetical protein FKM82_017940 [Ascaphus truei]
MADRGSWRPPRSCEDYRDEWKLCKSLRNLFHSYYTHGEAPACQQWKNDFSACRDWEKSRSLEAKTALRQSETARQVEKQKHPPVWTLRKRPPTDWYLPLDTQKPQQ